MMTRFFFLSGFLFSIFTSSAVFSDGNAILQDGDKTVPISFETDVLVLGGTVSAVAAAEESAKAGARTMLVTDCNYLGEDLTATLRLWKPLRKQADPLAATLYDDPDAIPVIPNVNALLKRTDRLNFQYTVEESFKEKHGENANNNRLADGIIGTIEKDTIQTDGHMTVRVDLGSEKEVGSFVFVGFHLTGTCVIETMRVQSSPDGQDYSPVGFGFRMPGVRPVSKKPDLLALKLATPQKARYWKVRLTHNGYSNSIFGAELFLFSSPNAVDDLTKSDKKVDSPPRPLHVKRVLDQTLLENDVRFLYGAFETGRVVDSAGRQKGVLISNRAGRQAIAAKQVIDLRDKSTAALEKLASQKPETATVEFVVVGGEKVEIDLGKYPIFRKARCEVSDQKYHGSKSSGEPQTIVPYNIYRYLFDIDREFACDAFSRDIAKLEELTTAIRLATFHPQQQFTADRVSLLAPGQDRFEFDQEALKRGRTTGKETGLTAKSEPKIDLKTLRAESGTVSPAPTAANPIKGETAELLDGIRPYEEQYGRVHLPGARYEVAGSYDVVVIGGGTTGAPAAIGAARTGAKTLVVELQSELGGVGTLGSINGYYHGNKTGFTAEVNEALYPGKKQNHWVASHKSNWWASEVRKAGGDVWTGVLGAGAVIDPSPVDGRIRVKGVLLATPFGPRVVLAKVVIDTTGSGDVARSAGSEMEFTTRDEITVQGAGLSPKGLGNFRMNNDYMFADDTDPIDVTHVYVYGKYKYPSAFDQGKVMGTRERWRIVGDFVITALDQLNLRTYDDSIARSWSDFDSHGYTTSEFLELYHPKKREAYYAYYPYRASLPRKLDGILVGALATSSHRDAIPMLRMQADLQNQGYALGYIAAVAAKQFGDSPVRLRQVDIRAAQKHLVDIGILPPAALTEKDNHEASKAGLAEAVEKLPQDAKNALLVMWHPNESLPLLKKAFEKTRDPEAKAVYARALALLGDKTGEQILLERVKNHDGWDKGWNFKAYQQFGSPSSQLDKDVMMLGRLKCRDAVPVIAQKLNELKPTDDFSHHRACYLALEKIGDPSAAKVLADHLKKPGMMGHVHLRIDDAVRADQSDPNVNLAEESRRNSLKEIGAARALYRLGDYEGLGKKILEAYSKDLRGHFARHAAEELKR